MVIKYNFIISLWRALYYSERSNGILAEWLRRKIRNLLGSARAGSNPADVVSSFSAYNVLSPGPSSEYSFSLL